MEAAVPLWDFTFTRGFSGWTVGDPSFKREGGNVYARLVGPEGNSLSALLSPVIPLDGETKTFELKFNCRTEVPKSALQSGAWVIFYILDEKGKLTTPSWTGVPVSTSSQWLESKTVIKIPAGTKTFGIGFRVQNRKGGVLDIAGATLTDITEDSK
jgi:hypothetical protein